MADRIIKGDSGNDVVIQNNAGSRKIEVTNSGDVEVTGDVKTTTVKATNLKANDGTAGLVVADSTGQVTSSGKIDLNGNELILDADADTSITADTDDQIDFRAGGADSVKIDNEHITINDGNLIIGTAGHGIDFSVNSHQTGMSSELFDFYEEGVWTASFNGPSQTGGAIEAGSKMGRYTRIGNLVTVHGQFQQGGSQTTASLQLSGLPFTSASNQTNGESISEGAVRLFNQETTLTPVGVVAHQPAGTSYVEFFSNNDNSAPTPIARDDSGYVAFSLTYTVA